jgi:predicted transcriptional regulator
LTAKPNSSTAFRLPQGVLATVDLICDQQDLTRSQVYRRSIMEYLKSQQVEQPTDQPKLTWSEVLYGRSR